MDYGTHWSIRSMEANGTAFVKSAAHQKRETAQNATNLQFIYEYLFAERGGGTFPDTSQS